MISFGSNLFTTSISILLDSDDDATACTEQSTLSKPVPERAIIMPELTQSSPIVANKKDEPVSLQPEQSSLSLLDDFDDLDPDLASSLMENSPDRSFHDISTDQSSSVKLTLKFQMILYPNVESFQEPSVKDISVLQKILKVYVMDVSSSNNCNSIISCHSCADFSTTARSIRSSD